MSVVQLATIAVTLLSYSTFNVVQPQRRVSSTIICDNVHPKGFSNECIERQLVCRACRSRRQGAIFRNSKQSIAMHIYRILFLSLYILSKNILSKVIVLYTTPVAKQHQ